MRYLVSFCLLVVCTFSCAAEPMERPTDTEEAWASQVDQVVEAQGESPTFTGMMVWSGRADREYKPFFQWELRLKAGDMKMSGLRLRIQPLAPDLSPLQQGRIGAWRALGNLEAGQEADSSYTFNTPIFSAYRVELTWRGGEATYLATDRLMLPMLEGVSDSIAQLVTLEPIWERSPRGKTVVKFWLHNTGGAAAKEVNLKIRLRDGDGQVVTEHPYVPDEGTIPAAYAKEHIVIIPKTPSFNTIQVVTAQVEQSAGFALDSMDFIGGDTVEVGQIQQQDGELMGAVRNGTGDHLVDIEIALYFTDAAGATVDERKVTLASLKPNETGEWKVDINDMKPWAGYETDLSYGIENGGVAEPAQAAAQQAQVVVEGLALTILDQTGTDGALKIKGELHNQTAADLPGLELTVEIAGASAPAKMKVGDLAKDERLTLTLVVEGVEQLTGLAMSWRSGQAP